MKCKQTITHLTRHALSKWMVGAMMLCVQPLIGSSLIGEVPGPATNLRNGVVTETTIELIWDHAIDPDGFINRYQVMRILPTSGFVVATFSPGGTTNAASTVTLTGLVAGTVYQFYIQSRDNDNQNAPNSGNFTISTKSTTGPTQPTGLQAANISSTGFDLSWSASTDDVGVTAYDVLKDGAVIATVTDGLNYTVTSLNPTTAYQFSVVAKDGDGTASPKSAILGVTTTADVTPPTAPTNLKVTAMTATSLNLDWDASTDNHFVERYIVFYREIGQSLQNQSFFGGPPASEYNLTGLVNGVTYEIYIQAADAASPRNTATGETISVTVGSPTRPVNLQGSVAGSTSVSLTWSASLDDVAVTAYDIYQDGEVIATVTDGTNYTVTGLSPDNTYQFSVTAKDGDGNVSPTSVMIGLSTAPDVTPPSQPNSPVASAITATGFNLTWPAVTDNVAVVQYDILIDNVLNQSVSEPSATVTGLTASTSYDVSIIAYDQAGNSSLASEIVKVVTESPMATGPTQPNGLQAASINEFGFDLSWSASTDDVGVTGYDIFQDGAVIATVTDGTNYTVAGLSPNTTYQFGVAAKDGDGNVSPTSEMLGVTTAADVTPPTTPANLRVTAMTSTSLNLIWDASTDNHFVERYIVFYREIGQDLKAQSFFGKNPASEYNLTGLVNGVTYEIFIEAADAASPRNTVRGETISVTVGSPTKPVNLQGSADGTSVSLTWSASLDDAGGITYEVYQDDVLVTSVTSLTATLTDVLPETSYEYHVIAKDANGNSSPATMTLEVTTGLDTTLPSQPMDLVATDITRTGFILTWSAATDNVGVVKYELLINNVLNQSVTESSATVIDLTANTNYDVSIIAYDQAGNSSLVSEIVKVKTANLLVAGSEDNLTQKVNVYPNPSLGGEFTITLHESMVDLKLEVYDAMGRTVPVSFSRPQQNRLNLNMNGFAPGLYWLKVFSRNELISEGSILTK